jgi:hypothetical protein
MASSMHSKSTKQNNAVVIHGESFLMLLPVQVSEASAPALALNYVN